MSKISLETLSVEGTETVSLDFGEDGQNLIPAIVQETSSGEVLLVAFMNREAFERTLQTGKAHFWSRSRQTLWLKGETSGQFLLVQEFFINCEENSLLLKVNLAGGIACHTGHKSCYYRRADWKPLQ
ncbi:phosphoribosyl-AMP cyclohydrolase [Candidatus Chlorohelix sp.]|uniref:phosphoribosyl-AMP cyclohydrolase n=1 Tax=Candidatus Chlorohelix sp. TaxID=3139201 RepID=UPI003062A5F1